VEAEGGVLGGDNVSQTKSVRKGRSERAMKTERKARTKTEEATQRKKKTSEKTNETTETVNEEKVKEEELKEEALKNEALNLFHEILQHGLKPFEGASVDFHQKRELVVFIPGKSPIIATVRHEELLEFLLKSGVRRVLVDALFPSRAEILSTISKAGIEVYFIRRLTVIEKFRKFLKKKLKIGASKNDFTDAVLQAFVKVKYLQRIDWRYLDCLLEMQLWRDNNTDYQKYKQRLKTWPKAKRDRIAKLVTDIEENARIFVNTVLKHYPEIAELFKEFNIEDDVVAQAYTCEVFLEVLPCDTRIGAINKAGIRLSDKPSKKKLIHDGRMSYALNQLAIKVYHLNPKKVDKVFKLMLVRKIWKFSRRIQMKQMKEEGGRVGEALERVGPESRDSGRPDLPKREGYSVFTPAHQGRGPAKAGVCR
jgi:predicted Fe-Mo cluster-binding NifX family protein